MRGLVTAFRTLTILPVPGRDSDKLSSSLPYFPLVGLFLGMITMGAVKGAALLFSWSAGTAVLCVVLPALLTRGLHLDGLADTFDALGARSRERRLEIMKDPHIGSFGVIALLLVLLLKFVAFQRIIERQEELLIPVAFVASRTAMVVLAVWLPYARATAGTAELFVKGATWIHLVVALVLGALASLASSSLLGPLFVAGAAAGALMLGFWMKKAFGGVTGDLLGMSSEMIETMALIAIAVV